MIVLLCEELERLGNGLDLQELEQWLAKREPGVEVRRGSGPCETLEAFLSQDLKGADRLVLGLCSGSGKDHELQARARRLGLDPFGIEAVDLGSYCGLMHPRLQATEKAKLLLGAALAKTRAYGGSRPENAKPFFLWDEKVSRRSLFTLPPVHYEAVPSIREEACVAEEGCRLCAKGCPHEALTFDDGRMLLDKAKCTGCGVCVSTCPRAAFDFPGASLSQMEAQVAALLDSPSLPHRGILFLCPRGVSALEGLARRGLSYPAGWLPVEVPCLGMVTPGWVLECLSRGAAAVGLLPCRREDCRFGQEEVMEGRADYCQALLEAMGGRPDSVRLLDPADPGRLARTLASLRGSEMADKAGDSPGGPTFAPSGMAEAVLGLAERYEAPLDLSVRHPHSPLGLVEVEEGCTACGACVSACPTGALALEREGEGISIVFDAPLCVGCKDCVPVCPERVVRVEKVTDLRRLSQGKRVLYRVSEARCVKCGAPVAPRPMLDRIRSLLGDHPAFSAISRYCLECRKTLI